ncbi:MAG: tRNA (adenosine(37)-N6)-threonylcarbamoyltransferase complex transferase subunit TsaD [Clostridia bacterium]|nr:tRNA (adenosine(37)-N6)-threonylcarbamoyltransferase complex transferase subunit TsaD [Clostridia bacterium]
MIILAIESSCDETAASISRDGREILSDVVYSQADMHALYGGVVPEIASRKHIEKISLVVDEAISKAGIKKSDIDAIAATCAPGLIGALLVGANFAKAAALALDVPFIPVHHIKGHISANYIAFPELKPPFIALVASGGHTIIVDVEDYTKMKLIGTTRDDAAGEAFDKIARVQGLPYPGGKILDELSQTGESGYYKLPKAEIKDHPYDFSFSGLKTAAINIIHNAQQKGEEINKHHMAKAVSETVADTVVPRVLAAAKNLGRDTVVAAGGVAANSLLRAKLEAGAKKQGVKLFVPPLRLCGDNGSMIACQAYYEYMAGNTADPSQNCFATMAVSDSFFEEK